MTVSFNEATKGHTIKRWGPPKHKLEETSCSCGKWKTKREKIRTEGKTKKEPIEVYRSRADQHLYDVWKKAQQGTLV